MVKLYTRTGDSGTTGLLGPKRVPKDDLRVEAIGAVDELNAALGMALAAQRQRRIRDALRQVQDDLFTVGAELAMPGTADRGRLPTVRGSHVKRLEGLLERFESGSVKSFVLPRGSEALARLHWTRALARRTERRVVSLSKRDELNPELLRYLNRLSSLLYQMAIWLQRQERSRPLHPSYRR